MRLPPLTSSRLGGCIQTVLRAGDHRMQMPREARILRLGRLQRAGGERRSQRRRQLDRIAIQHTQRVGAARGIGERGGGRDQRRVVTRDVGDEQ